MNPQFLPVPLSQVDDYFKLKKKCFNIQLSTATLCEREMGDETDLLVTRPIIVKLLTALLRALQRFDGKGRYD